MSAQRLLRHTLSPERIGLNATGADDLPLRRRPAFDSFEYIQSCGRPVGKAVAARINSLAIPPAWQRVRISQDPKNFVLAVGDDDAGRRQYVYHPRWREACEQAKFIDLPRFAEALPRLRSQVKKDLKNEDDLQTYAKATVVRLLDRAGLRVGSWGNTTFGAVSLQTDHIEIARDIAVLDFTGKGGAARHAEIKDATLISALSTLYDDAETSIFVCDDQRITASSVNAYIKSASGLDFTAKDFRTWGGSVRAARSIFKHGATTIKEVSEAASAWLGNTPTIARNSYIHPAIIEAVATQPKMTLTGPVRLRKYERAAHSLMSDYSASLPSA
ncbi:MAG: DNA topoisomerase IB [Pseudomonadota bacterium]